MKRRLVILFVVIFCVVVFSGGILAHAQERREETGPYYKYYTSIRVEPGDTLWDIAGRYMEGTDGTREEYIEELMELNGLPGDRIIAGQYLTVIYYSAEYK